MTRSFEEYRYRYDTNEGEMIKTVHAYADDLLLFANSKDIWKS
jgi:hypothetical protein